MRLQRCLAAFPLALLAACMMVGGSASPAASGLDAMPPVVSREP
jgi:hypothetical protein